MRALWIGLVWLLCGPALAQEVVLEPSAVQRCLQPAVAERGVPAYPKVALQRRGGGKVKVELSFTTPDKRPAVKILESTGGEDFEAAVEDHVRSYRVPCLQYSEIPARMVIEFVFKADDQKVTWTDSLHAEQEAKRAMLACLKHASGESGPVYPLQARRQEVQGRVLLLMHFDAPDRAPRVEVFARPSARMLADTITDWAQDYRLPCHSGGPLVASRAFHFYLGDSVYGFKSANLPLMQFLRSMRGLSQARVNFDFNAMACPFEVKLAYFQPLRPNAVGQVGVPHPARQAFLDWLAAVELDLPGDTLDALFGDKVTLSVPCVKINLTPKE